MLGHADAAASSWARRRERAAVSGNEPAKAPISAAGSSPPKTT